MTKDLIIQEILESGETVLPKHILEMQNYDELVVTYNRVKVEMRVRIQKQKLNKLRSK